MSVKIFKLSRDSWHDHTHATKFVVSVRANKLGLNRTFADWQPLPSADHSSNHEHASPRLPVAQHATSPHWCFASSIHGDPLRAGEHCLVRPPHEHQSHVHQRATAQATSDPSTGIQQTPPWQPSSAHPRRRTPHHCLRWLRCRRHIWRAGPAPRKRLPSQSSRCWQRQHHPSSVAAAAAAAPCESRSPTGTAARQPRPLGHAVPTRPIQRGFVQPPS